MGGSSHAVRFVRLASLAFVTVQMGCDPFGGCTLIGCFDGFHVVVSGDVVTPITVEAHTADTTVTVVPQLFSYGGDPPRTEYRAHFEFTPAEVTIRVLTATDTTEVTVQLQYDTSRPNGALCGPACRYGGEVNIEM